MLARAICCCERFVSCWEYIPGICRLSLLIILKLFLDKRKTSLDGSKQFQDFLIDVNALVSAIPEGKLDDDIRETNRLIKVS